MRIAAVIVTYNRKILLEECLNAVLNQEGMNCDVIVVDNASTDGTDQFMAGKAAEDSRIKSYRLDQNTGGAGGFYYGIKKAVELGYDYSWIMDDDTIPNDNCLKELIDADITLDGPKNYGFLSSSVYWVDGSECKMNRQKVSKQYYKYLNCLENGMIQVDQATFVSLLIPSHTVKLVGLPIKEYFIWGDDIEYTRRIAVRNKMPSFMVGKSKVVHKMSNNEGSSISTDDVARISRYNYAYRNDNRTYRYEGIKGFIYYTGKCGINVLRILKNSKNHRSKRIMIIIKNYFKGLFFNPKIEGVPKEE